MEKNIKREGNQFYIGSDINHAFAVISFYYDSADTIIINHTYVTASLRDRGIGKALVNEVAYYAKEKRLKVLPLCGFAERVMQNSVDYTEVLERQNQVI